MSLDSVATDNKPLEGVKAYAEEVTAKRDAQAQRYEAAKAQTNVWTEATNKAHKKFMTAKVNSNGKKTSELSSALAYYNTTCNSRRDAEINEDIARGSYTDAIFFAGKINTQAILAG